MKTYRIPQPTEIDEPIIGDFTLRQAVYLFTFGSLTYLFLLLKTFLFLKVIGIGFCTIFAWAFITLKPQGKALEEWLVNYIIFLVNPRRRVWREKEEPTSCKYQSRKLAAFLKSLLAGLKVGDVKKLVSPSSTGLIEVASNEPEFLDIEEQVKGILESYFFSRWEQALRENPQLEVANITQLLLFLEQYVASVVEELKILKGKIKEEEHENTGCR
jgi:hypothetical protein